MKKFCQPWPLLALFSGGLHHHRSVHRTNKKISNTAGGAALGALAGAGVGMLAGGDDRRNALIGAGIGALGRRRCRQFHGSAGGRFARPAAGNRRIRHSQRATRSSSTCHPTLLCKRSGSGDPGFYPTLNSVALVLNKYNQTLVDIYGHTDSDGDDGYNLALSQRRAQSVGDYLRTQSVDPRRFLVTGIAKPVRLHRMRPARARLSTGVLKSRFRRCSKFHPFPDLQDRPLTSGRFLCDHAFGFAMATAMAAASVRCFQPVQCWFSKTVHP